MMETTESTFDITTMSAVRPYGRWQAVGCHGGAGGCVPLCPEYDHANVERDGIHRLTPQRWRDAGHSGDHLATVNAGIHQGNVLGNGRTSFVDRRF